MSEQENLKVVQGIFESFGRGDIPALLQLCADDINWTINGPEDVGYFGERHGHEGVEEFFKVLGSRVDFESFEPQEFIAKDDKVVVLGREIARVKETGRSFDNDWAMVFTVREGKVVRFKAYENTHAVAQAFGG